MVQVARKLRLQNMTKVEILEMVIHKKVNNIRILEDGGMCSMDQVKPCSLNNAFSKLASNANTNKTVGTPPEEDIRTGYQLFHAVIYCPDENNIKLFRFVDDLLSSESSRTIIQTFVHLFKSGSIKDFKRLKMAKQFYYVLARTLHLQYGNILVGTSTKSQLQAEVDKKWPFLPLFDSPDEIQRNFQNLGILTLLIF